jgi:hypothetical protein
MLPILGGDLPSAGDVGCMRIFCKNKFKIKIFIIKKHIEEVESFIHSS